MYEVCKYIHAAPFPPRNFCNTRAALRARIEISDATLALYEFIVSDRCLDLRDSSPDHARLATHGRTGWPPLKRD